jgi:3-isopropylmalate/(R)-2-methylmalate dehydratase small subunit
MSGSPILRVTGPAIVLDGDDIDTDRIMPARFLKAVTFDGLEAHVFEDDRREAAARGARHPFDDPARRGARVLIAGRNFGCGSSREHAPQGLFRRGIRAIVGASFAEIFFGNAVMIGLPCVVIGEADLARARAMADADASAEWIVDLGTMTVSAGGQSLRGSMPESSRQALLSGDWDATGILLRDYDVVRQCAAGIPYLSGF